jgi:hypothetical protein
VESESVLTCSLTHVRYFVVVRCQSAASHCGQGGTAEDKLQFHQRDLPFKVTMSVTDTTQGKHTIYCGSDVPLNFYSMRVEGFGQ